MTLRSEVHRNDMVMVTVYIALTSLAAQTATPRDLNASFSR